MELNRSIPLEHGSSHRLRTVFFLQQANVFERDLDWHIFEVTVSQWENLGFLTSSQPLSCVTGSRATHIKPMAILAHQSTRLTVFLPPLVVLAYRSDIDE